DSRGYDRGYERYDRGYDRGGYDRYDRGGYDRSREYDRGGYDRYDRGKLHLNHTGNDEDRSHSKTLYVGNLPYTYRESDVDEMFKRFGKINKVTVVLDQYTGRNKGFAFVEFDDRKDAEDAMEKFNGFDVDGRRLKLDWDIGLTKKDIKPPRARANDETMPVGANVPGNLPVPGEKSEESSSYPTAAVSDTPGYASTAAEATPLPNEQLHDEQQQQQEYGQQHQQGTEAYVAATEGQQSEEAVHVQSAEGYAQEASQQQQQDSYGYDEHQQHQEQDHQQEAQQPHGEEEEAQEASVAPEAAGTQE
ncbi:hypothetical protein BGZ73_006025, partial [Actinomortierella ambigua]